MIRLGILGSTRGTNLIALVNAIKQQRLSADIKLVVSNKENAGILTVAQQNGIKTKYVDPTGLTREKYDENVSTVLQAASVDLVVLIGYMRILSSSFVADWSNKIINVHPSLLPAFAGLMDLAVHQAVIDVGETETGCTVHYVTEQVDAGPILLQKTCQVMSNDTPEILKSRVQALEGQVLIESIQMLSQRLSC